jgi:hypothetical protein
MPKSPAVAGQQKPDDQDRRPGQEQLEDEADHRGKQLGLDLGGALRPEGEDEQP